MTTRQRPFHLGHSTSRLRVRRPRPSTPTGPRSSARPSSSHARIVIAFTAPSKHVLEAHCARIGIQHEQLIRHPGQAPPPPNREARRRAARENKKI